MKTYSYDTLVVYTEAYSGDQAKTHQLLKVYISPCIYKCHSHKVPDIHMSHNPLQQIRFRVVYIARHWLKQIHLHKRRYHPYMLQIRRCICLSYHILLQF